ncbi:MAG: hypothetical protein ACREXX_22855 [Gammaproteobacteria bacterium]
MPWWPALALWLGLCSPALALEVFEGFQVHGFLSQGYFKTSANNVFGNSDENGSLDFTEIGINASWTPLPRLQLSTQLISRRAGEADDGEIELDVGLADYSFLDTAELRFGVRLGRVRVPLGLYNDTRDVAFTRPSILLPQSIYPDITRALSLSADGAMFYGEYRSSWGDFTLESGPLLPRVTDSETEFALFLEDLPGDLEPRLSYFGRLVYDLGQGRLRLALSGGQVVTAYKPRFTPPNDLQAGTDLFQPVIVSAQYNSEHWTFTSEYARRAIKDEGFSPDFDLDVVGESYYFQGIYRLNTQWETVLRYDVLFNNVDDRDGTKLKAATQNTTPANTQFAKDWTVGLRYTGFPWFMVAAEYHRVYGTAWLSDQDNPDDSRLEKQWDLFALLVSFQF